MVILKHTLNKMNDIEPTIANDNIIDIIIWILKHILKFKKKKDIKPSMANDNIVGKHINQHENLNRFYWLNE